MVDKSELYVALKRGGTIIAAAMAFLIFGEISNSIQLIDRVRVMAADLVNHPALFCLITVAVAFLETVVLICLYFPGTTIIAIFAATVPLSAAQLAVFCVALNLGTLAGAVVNYAIGARVGERLPWFSQNSIVLRCRELFERYGLGWTVLAAWHPNWLGATFAALAIIKLPAMRYLLIAMAAANVFGVIYFKVIVTATQNLDLSLANHHRYVSAGIAFWGVCVVGYHIYRRRKAI